MKGKPISFQTMEELFDAFRVPYDPARLSSGRLPLLLRFRRYLREAGLSGIYEAESDAWRMQRELLAKAYREAAAKAEGGGCGGGAGSRQEAAAAYLRSPCAACRSKGGCGQ